MYDTFNYRSSYHKVNEMVINFILCSLLFLIRIKDWTTLANAMKLYLKNDLTEYKPMLGEVIFDDFNDLIESI